MPGEGRVSADDLEAAVAGAVGVLRGAVDRDWSVTAGAVSWSCRRTAAHVADDLIAYAAQLVSRARDGYLPFRLTPQRNTNPEGLLQLIEATGALLATAVRAAPSDARAFHPYGTTDAEGLAAIGIGEVVLHTHDIATGLGLEYAPDPAVCARVIARLRRDIEPDEDPWALLLWATGRGYLPGRERVHRWRWSAAPLDDEATTAAPTPPDQLGRPRELIEAASAAFGATSVARWCADLLAGRVALDDPGRPSLTWLGGAAAAAAIGRRGRRDVTDDYWPRVWAARGLLYSWTPNATSAVTSALADPAWRVREMAAKVVRRREVGEAANALVGVVVDVVPRVRVAALRGLAVVGEAEHAAAIRGALDDAEPTVRRAADAALAELARRLDRDL